MYTLQHPLAASHSSIFLLPNQGHRGIPSCITLFQRIPHPTSHPKVVYNNTCRKGIIL